MSNSFALDKLMVGENFPPVIIAEMSGNHNQSLERALRIVDAAAAAGAHVLKLQTYTADTMTLNIDRGEFFIADQGSLWKGRNLYDIYQEAHTPWAWHEAIFDRCRSKNIVPLSSAFDASSVDFLESLNVPAYKIASFENIDLPLIKKVSSTGKPVIISTGMATEEEISESVQAARSAGCNNLVLLKCTSTYPAPATSSNLRAIPILREKYSTLAGLSDHTPGIGTSIASVAFGAVIIEKHFCLSRADGGVDSAFSLEPNELKLLVEETRRAWESLGKAELRSSEDSVSRKYRRSIYVVEDLEKGSILSEKNIRSIRPGLGLMPKYLPELLGKKLKVSARKGTALSWDMIEVQNEF